MPLNKKTNTYFKSISEIVEWVSHRISVIVVITA